MRALGDARLAPEHGRRARAKYAGTTRLQTGDRATRRLTITLEVAKYEPLREFLAGLPQGQKQVTLGFKRLEELLGDALPPSALTYEQWWHGGRVKRGRIDANWQDQVQQRAWDDAGWTVEDLDLLLKNVTFRRR
jgi:hypothetical protein